MRHVLIAVALMDEPVPLPDTARLLSRSQRVLHHYNLAIRVLTRPGTTPSPLDMTLTSILSWLLEVMGFNSPVAKMHISAAANLARQHFDPRLRRLAPALSKNGSAESDSIMSIDVPALLSFCESYLATTPAGGKRSTPDELKTESAQNPVLAALLLRQGPCPIQRAEEFRDAWILYFTRLQPLQPDGMSVKDAEEYIAYWKVAILRYRYIMTVPPSIVLLGYLTAALARCMLPVNDDELLPDWAANDGSLDYILARAIDMTPLEMGPEHRLLLEEMLCIVATTVERFVPNDKQRQLAATVMQGCCHRLDFYVSSGNIAPYESATYTSLPLCD